MRYILLALALVTGGCYGESVRAPADPQDEPGPEGTEVFIDPELLAIPTSELGTDRTHPIAKTIEWPGISTEEGASYAGDAVVVDRILRDDASNSYAVRVRLKNTTKDVQKLSWIIRFYSRHGGQIMGYVGSIGSGERWQGVVLEPYGTAVVHDFARVIGAEGFRLFVRGAGAKTEGLPDDPSPEAKEERDRQRQAPKQP